MCLNRGLRNVVVHEYFRVNPDMIRDIVDNVGTLLDDIG
ncbi:MAG TPA: HepT-like ribonuclease domain-containing protein [Propionibacteriaceae bacterium]|nr:HepT-like ribonuclease domain-containing protein [Propionibacteriaceae bacterium]